MSVSNHLIVDQGDSRRWTVYFYDTNQVLAAPSSLVMIRRRPTESTGTTVTTGWTSNATGVYFRDIVFDIAGLWELEARGTGLGVDQIERLTVDVRPSRVN